MELIIKSREKVIFQGDVDNVTSYNKTGIFNILMDHSNFISIVSDRVVIIKRGARQEIPVENALLKVKENKIYVYVGVK